MKVKDLIEKLKNTDPEAEVFMRVPNFESDYNELHAISDIKLDLALDVNLVADDCWDEEDDKKQ